MSNIPIYFLHSKFLGTIFGTTLGITKGLIVSNRNVYYSENHSRFYNTLYNTGKYAFYHGTEGFLWYIYLPTWLYHTMNNDRFKQMTKHE